MGRCYTPLKLSQGKFETDRSAAANKLNLEGALRDSFWNFAPEKEIKNYSAADVIKTLNQTIRRLENTDTVSSMRSQGAREQAKSAIRSAGRG